ncbi:MAG: V-type ATP synthase subunit F [Clostridia bacterium]|nr:V-type ATP synthase subunit F [Clostridia bacterium]
MYKIGIIGDRDSVLGFMALGFAVHEIQNGEDAGKKISELVKSGEYAVIFITEDLALVTEEERAKYKDMPLPAITVIPSSKGSRGYGMANIKSAVERAVGADILFKDSE